MSNTIATKHRHPRHALLSIGLILAGGFWILESVIHAVALNGAAFHLFPDDLNELWMRSVICGMFVGFGIYADRVTARLHHVHVERQHVQQQLEASMAKVLGGFLSICAHCKRISTDDEWIGIETYVRDHTDTEFSHTICPRCERKHFPGFEG